MLGRDSSLETDETGLGTLRAMRSSIMKIIAISFLVAASAVACNKNHDADDVDQTRTTSAIVVEPTIDDTNGAEPETNVDDSRDASASIVMPPMSITSTSTMGDGGKRDLESQQIGRGDHGESFERSGGSSGLGTTPLRQVPGQNLFDTK